MSAEQRQFVFVAEVTMAIDALGTLQTHLCCSGEGFATLPTDTPAHVAVPPTLLDPGSLRREMFSGDRVFGAVRPAFGEVVLYNGDGRYDAWEHHGFDGRPFVLRWGPLGGAYPADFTTVVICTVEGVTLTETEARLKLRDESVLLDKPFLSETFSGLTVAEGQNTGMKGQIKHRYINTPRWLGPQLQVITNIYGGTIYHVSTGKSVVAPRFFDNANELILQYTGGDFWGGSAPEPGRFWLWEQDNNIYVRLGSRAQGDLRMYLNTGQPSAPGTRVPWTAQAFLAEAGYAGPVIGAPLPGIKGVFADSSITYGRIFDDAATNAGMWYGFDRLGRFVAEVFDAPTGGPALTLSRSNCLNVKRSPVPGMEVPLHQLSINSVQTWKSNYTAPSTWSRDNFAADQWLRRYSHTDDTVLTKHPAARSVHMDLLIGPESDVQFAALRNRYLALFGVDRSLFTVAVPLSAEALGLDLGDVVRLVWPRFNLSGGRLLRVVSVRYDLRARRLEFALWG